MEYRFYRINVDIDKVVRMIEEFFKEREFKVSVLRESNKEAVIISKSSRDHSLPKITVKVSLSSDFLSVNFLTSSRIRNNMFLASVMGLFGGNFFVPRLERLKKKVEEVEEEFWKVIESKFESSSLS